ncbi:hypothetical protein A3C23_05180 [Candidatus Roizmanbacteria bacterium RIFCSPHIGHO2_02_FULL_37_13b]|uniref:YtxH domain-containing protein n=1 Tax=Candidatus Roizmanbacteria bacterium RIFCSPLOWO2_02_FULL_36_11 TaxID=1802071 RepID=A0A1F7JFL7_9BACT|nr:MAG: hypothetical protein A3C23_05180 [Candidatus Roizmanbacteria bacterium RIFCSPHIGHO2_02_FULL_37_13b]OGK54413.1 MAG: hypothetical protein A3H78_03790 [Candidatus Roizmanbacteria bacterium RIFCSPLOWO2_02_FULL_36_11]
MKTNEQVVQPSKSDLWSGIIIGLILGAGGLFFLGTKAGREQLRKLLELIEDMELSTEDMIKTIEDIASNELLKHDLQEGTSNVESGNIENVMSKIKMILPTGKKSS